MRHKYGKLQMILVASGLILYGLTAVFSRLSDKTGGLKALVRAGPGKGVTVYDVWVHGLDEGEDKIALKIDVSDKQYTEEEASHIFEEMIPMLASGILGENKSLEEVRTNLLLGNSLAVEFPEGVTVRWESENPEILDQTGGVYNQSLGEDGVEFYLRAYITDGIHEQEYDLPLHIYPPVLTPEEMLLNSFKASLSLMDKKDRTKAALDLPKTYENKPLTYGLQNSSDYRMIPILGIVGALFLAAKEKSEKQEEKKQREKQLLLDYPEVIAKLLVLTGAGMTIRLAWEKIVDDYEKKKVHNQGRERAAYEEMSKTTAQLRSGTPESRAYGEFGRRCALQPYLKLGALLEQNQKTGGRSLKAALELEMISAFEERKNLAKRLGEEAGTKLLLPLFLMLGIVMVMIVVPAFLAFF